jgi:predicted nicotinamide N-methyase
MGSDPTTEFIRANTRLLSPPLVPEIKLHLAEESLPIWYKTEEELGLYKNGNHLTVAAPGCGVRRLSM